MGLFEWILLAEDIRTSYPQFALFRIVRFDLSTERNEWMALCDHTIMPVYLAVLLCNSKCFCFEQIFDPREHFALKRLRSSNTKFIADI